METRRYRSPRNKNDSGKLSTQTLTDLVGKILKTDATPEAIRSQLSELDMEDSELTALVDFLIERTHPMLYGEHPVKMLDLSERAFFISEYLDYEKGMANSLLYMGTSQWFTSHLSDSLKNLVKARNLFTSQGDEEGQMRVRVFEACVYRSMGDYDQSYLDLKRCVEFFHIRRDKLWEATSLLSLALTCEQIGDYEGMQQYNQRIIQKVTQPELQWIVGRALDGIGTIHYRSGDYKKAIGYYEKSLATCRRSQHPVGEARALNDLGMLYQKLGEAQTAEKYYQQSLDIRKAIDQIEAQCTCLFNLGVLALKGGEPAKALGYFEQALSIAIEVDVKPRILQAYKNLSTAYEALGDWANALKCYKSFQKINDEVVSEQSNTRIRNLITRLELDKAERVAEVERQKNAKLSEKNDELQQLLKELQTAQAHLVQAEKMATLGKLVSGIAHEMNSPVGASTSSIDISNRCIAKITDMLNPDNTHQDDKNGDHLEKLLDTLRANNNVVSKANERISNIVTSLRFFSNLDEAAFRKSDIHEGLDSTITLLEAELNDRISLRKQYGKLPEIVCYPGELNQVFLNLFTNSIEAIRRSDRPGEIVIHTSVKDSCVVIRISDTGTGMSTEKLKSLFDPGFSDDSTRVKAGMGMFISQNIIRKHNGKITVTSETGQGTTFHIHLPTDLNNPAEE
jgi:signal transduction histidine kinase